MKPHILERLFDRLQSSALQGRAADLVLAACLGDDQLTSVAAGATLELPEEVADGGARVGERSYLRSISVEGFRGIGPGSRLDLEPGPGLTLVLGRNGSGKSSFAEAAELLLTGENSRWTGRAAGWSEGWRNLHHRHAAIDLELAVDGRPGSVTLSGRWADSSELAGLVVTAQVDSEKRASVADLAWDDPIRTYRPFLSYNELGAALADKPATLYDALEAVLGLGDISDASNRLRVQRLQLEKIGKGPDVASIARRCNEVTDERADQAHAIVTARKPNLTELETLLEATETSGGSEQLGVLRQVANLTGPDWRSAAAAAIDLRFAATEAAAVAGTDAGRAQEVADLLDAALGHHDRHGDGPCPVCGGRTLDATWRASAEAEVGRLKADARAATAARVTLRRALDEGMRQLIGPPMWLDRPVPGDIQVESVVASWRAWASADPADPGTLADHLDRADAITSAVEDVRAAAAREVASRDDQWRPLARQLETWCHETRVAGLAAESAKQVKAAESWLKQAAADLRDERFEPIAEQSRALWDMLRQQSNVELGAIEMNRSGNMRKVSLSVTVDGVPASALGVMSQGELHALALSLFLPRATSADSPFRFIVIDDPVQAMDPARVDGLARVLAETALTHQVVVFTHDDRLAESIRRQRIPARVLEVARRAESRVDVRVVRPPVAQAIDDARALALTDELPAPVAQRVVPGLCRVALEAACTEVIRRRDIAAGIPHAEVEAGLLAADKLTKRLAMLLHGDMTRTASISDDMEHRFGRSSVEVLRRVNKGAHEGDSGDLRGLVDNTERVVKELLGVR